MCTAVPVAYLFNVSIMKYVVYPINAMAFLMERYFSVSEQERAERFRISIFTRGLSQPSKNGCRYGSAH